VADECIDAYYQALFGKLGTRGLIVTAYVAPAISLSKGKYAQARRDPQATGRAIEAAIRKYNRPSVAGRCWHGRPDGCFPVHVVDRSGSDPHLAARPGRSSPPGKPGGMNERHFPKQELPSE